MSHHVKIINLLIQVKNPLGACTAINNLLDLPKLNKYQRISNEKPYKCKQCLQSFVHLSNLIILRTINKFILVKTHINVSNITKNLIFKNMIEKV